MAQRVEVNSHGNICTLYNRGFTYDFLSRTGKLAFWKLAEYYTYCRLSMLMHPESLTHDGQYIFPDSTMFVVVVDYHMTKEFYRTLRRFIERHTLVAKTEMLNFGKSSMIYQTSILKPSSGDALSMLRFKYVVVDPDTRKSTTLPNWFVEKYGRLVNSSESFRPYVLPNVPSDKDKVHRMPYTINASDMDQNQHTNNAVYYRLCFDAATEASLYRKLFKEMPGDVCNYDVRSTQGIYMKECRLGDAIEVVLWQDPVYRDTLHFQIDKVQDERARQPLFRTTIQFYLDQAKL